MYVEAHERAPLRVGGTEDRVIRLGQVLTVMPLAQRHCVNGPFSEKASYLWGDMLVKQEAYGHSGADLTQPGHPALETLGTEPLCLFDEGFDFVFEGFSIGEC